VAGQQPRLCRSGGEGLPVLGGDGQGGRAPPQLTPHATRALNVVAPVLGDARRDPRNVDDLVHRRLCIRLLRQRLAAPAAGRRHALDGVGDLLRRQQVASVPLVPGLPARLAAAGLALLEPAPPEGGWSRSPSLRSSSSTRFCSRSMVASRSASSAVCAANIASSFAKRSSRSRTRKITPCAPCRSPVNAYERAHRSRSAVSTSTTGSSYGVSCARSGWRSEIFAAGEE